MKKLWQLLSVPVVLLGLFSLFAPNTLHISASHESMAGMNHATNVTQKNVQCQATCNAAPTFVLDTIIRQNIDETKSPQALALLLSFAAFGLAQTRFNLKQLFGLASWRPPDKVLLYGHYADGL